MAKTKFSLANSTRRRPGRRALPDPRQDLAPDAQRVALLEVDAHAARPDVDVPQAEPRDLAEPLGTLLRVTDHAEAVDLRVLERFPRIEVKLAGLPARGPVDAPAGGAQHGSHRCGGPPREVARESRVGHDQASHRLARAGAGENVVDIGDGSLHIAAAGPRA